MNPSCADLKRSAAHPRDDVDEGEQALAGFDVRQAQLRSSDALVPCSGRFIVRDGALEALKWTALVLMLLDHINKFFFAETLPGVFALGRIVMPIFGFVLVYNLSRPGALERGVHRRMVRRLAATAVLATPVTIALNQTVVNQHAWWPLNILWTLLVVVVLIELLERGGALRYAVAAAVLVAAGAWVEYLWMGVLACLGAWAFCREAKRVTLFLWCLGVLSLSLVNGNVWALAAIPLICVVKDFPRPLPPHKWVFYAFYPIHLTALWLIKYWVIA